MPTYQGVLHAQDLKIGLVVARFNSFITERLLEGAQDALVRSEAGAATRIEQHLGFYSPGRRPGQSKRGLGPRLIRVASRGSEALGPAGNSGRGGPGRGDQRRNCPLRFRGRAYELRLDERELGRRQAGSARGIDYR